MYKYVKNMFKKYLFIIGIIISSFLFASCNTIKNDNKNTEKLVIFAAASMTETLTEISKNYKEKNNHVDIIFNFDSSGTLKTQIEEGVECDIFISASPKQMDQLDINADKSINKNFIDKIDSNTRFNLLENKVVLVVSDIENKKVDSYTDLINKLKNNEVTLSIGNDDVPVGQYTQKIFNYFGLTDDYIKNNINTISYGSNVKEVTTQVKEKVVDCGIVYGTDAKSSNLNVIDYATKEMCGQVIYPIAILKEAKQKELAEDFINYLKTDESKNIFSSVGFSPLY